MNQKLINSEVSDTASVYASEYDESEGFLPTPKTKLIPWTYFLSNVSSDEASSKFVLDVIAYDHADELVDLRPYMIEQPYTVQTNNDLDRCLELFRHMHLRHLPVVVPGSGALVGIITRKDLFAYLSL